MTPTKGSQVPSVSIVIPTRNRGKLLRYALSSALNQDYDNLQIVVCDNDSADDTPTVGRVDDPRVTYVRTSESLSMPDNWEFALTHATGEYVCYLTDDSYLLKGAIRHAVAELIARKAQVAVWKHAAYFAADWLEQGRRNVLHVPNVSGAAELVPSRTLLERLYRMESAVVTSIPKSLNSIVHRDVIRRVLDKQGRFFLPSCPDYTSAASVLLHVDACLVIDRVGFLDGVTPESIGAVAAFNLGDSVKKFFKEFGDAMDEIGFLGLPTANAAIGRSLEFVRVKNHGTCPRVDGPGLLRTVIDDLARLEAHGADVQVYWETLDQHLSESGASGMWLMKPYRAATRLKWRAIHRARLGRHTRQLERVRGVEILKGERLGFSNIAEAAAVLMQNLEPRARMG